MPDRLEVEFRTIRLFKNFFHCNDAPPTLHHKYKKTYWINNRFLVKVLLTLTNWSFFPFAVNNFRESDYTNVIFERHFKIVIS